MVASSGLSRYHHSESQQSNSLLPPALSQFPAHRHNYSNVWIVYGLLVCIKIHHMTFERNIVEWICSLPWGLDYNSHICTQQKGPASRTGIFRCWGWRGREFQVQTLQRVYVHVWWGGWAQMGEGRFVGLLVGCLMSQQQASVSQGRICSDNFACCHTEIEVADPTVYLTQSQYTDTGLTSPSADPITPGAWQCSHWSANF